MSLASRPIAVMFAVVMAARPCGAAADEKPVGLDALQVMADLTLIDGDCQNVVVNFGVGFRFAASHGVPPETIMPGGARRAAFEAVLQAREANFGPDELCGQIARNYAEALPASVVPTYGHGEGKP